LKGSGRSRCHSKDQTIIKRERLAPKRGKNEKRSQDPLQKRQRDTEREEVEDRSRRLKGEKISIKEED